MSVKKKLELLRRKQQVIDGLPHLYGFDWYGFQKDFIDTDKEWQFLTCANQIGKTTVLLAKLVHLATDQTRWAKCWKDRPQLFIYLLPSQKLHDENCLTKWLDVLPKNEYKDDDYYGWEWEKRGKNYLGINFKNGVRLVFKSFGMKTQNLQSLSASVIAFDEEPDKDLVPEVQTRTQAIRVAEGNMENAYGGFKLFVFTATKSQEYFRKIMEERGKRETFPVSQGNVFKKCVSLFDCQKHVSGKPSRWTDEAINRIIKSLPTDAEIKRRVYGRFQATEGLIYQSFSTERNVIDEKPFIPDDFYYFCGIDYGAGGSAHPSAIVFTAVAPDYSYGYVTDIWVGQGEVTTCSDVVDKYISMAAGKNVVNVYYDFAAKDLHTFAQRRGIAFLRANKNHKIGEDLLNALFKQNMLKIFRDDQSSHILVSQLSSMVRGKINKTNDDAPDALRYCISSINWDFTNSQGIQKIEKALSPKRPNSYRLRDGRMWPREKDDSEYFAEQEESEWAGYIDEFY